MGTVSDFAPLMRSIPMFREVGAGDLDELCRALRERPVKAGELVVSEGDVGHELYIILEGEFQVFVRQESLDFEKQLRRLGPGHYFGEIAVLAGGKRTASVRAVIDGRVAVLNQLTLTALLERTGSIGAALCRGMALYVRASNVREVGIPFIDLSTILISPEAAACIPPRVSFFTRSVAVLKDGDILRVAMVDPYDAPARVFLREVLRAYQIEWAAISRSDFERYAAEKLRGQIDTDVSDADLADMSYVTPGGQAVDLGDRDTAQLLERVFKKAFKFGASDLHFEPMGDQSRVRMRIDGNMASVEEGVDGKMFAQVVSRLKVMGELDITNRRLPQDGRFVLRAGARALETRVSVLPCKGGEKVVLRTLNPAKQLTRLDQLIASTPVAMLVREMFLSSSGLVLVTGPTGSGKTTTLYAGLNEVWRESNTCNVVTIEDPIEYQLEFATQTQVNRAAHLEFPTILRSVLRQDPDVMLVGEIRDEESAVIAVEAGTTGHLVLSSLHTDTALDAIVRLRNLGVKPYLVASALKCVINQRLAPRLCEACAAPAALSPAARARLRELGVIDDAWAGVAYAGKGCDACRGTGTRGRVGVFEVLVVNGDLRDSIERGGSYAELSACLAPPSEYLPMARYARFLIENKMVGVEEVSRLFPAR